MTTIAFISQLTSHEQLSWKQRLNQCFGELSPNITVKLEHEISEPEKRDVTIAIVANPKPAVFGQYPNLIWIQSLWAGVDRLVAELKTPAIKVARLIDPCLAQTMAEASVAWSYYLLRDMALYRSQQSSHIWQQHPVRLATDTHIGILGLGELGQRAADLLQANGFQVSGWSRSQKSVANITCYSGQSGFEMLLERIDILLILLPLTASTHHLINRATIAKLKQGSAIINFSRGAVIDEQALLDALEQQRISHAVLDVFTVEPLPQQHAFWHHPKITVLPHISAPTNQTTACDIVCRNIIQFLEQDQLPELVDMSRGY